MHIHLNETKDEFLVVELQKFGIKIHLIIKILLNFFVICVFYFSDFENK